MISGVAARLGLQLPFVSIYLHGAAYQPPHLGCLVSPSTPITGVIHRCNHPNQVILSHREALGRLEASLHRTCRLRPSHSRIRAPPFHVLVSHWLKKPLVFFSHDKTDALSIPLPSQRVITASQVHKTWSWDNRSRQKRKSSCLEAGAWAPSAP